jgi:hypothetical protein
MALRITDIEKYFNPGCQHLEYRGKMQKHNFHSVSRCPGIQNFFSENPELIIIKRGVLLPEFSWIPGYQDFVSFSQKRAGVFGVESGSFGSGRRFPIDSNFQVKSKDFF